MSRPDCLEAGALCLILGWTANAALGRAPSTRTAELARVFSGVYRDPVFEPITTGLPGIELYSVFDSSQAAEDPLIPACWLVVAGEKRRLRLGNVGWAMTRVGLRPRTEAEALAVGQLAFRCGDDVVLTGPVEDLPRAHRHLVVTPRAEKTAYGWRVTLVTLHRDAALAWMRQPATKTLSRYIIELSGTDFRYRSEELWSSRG